MLKPNCYGSTMSDSDKILQDMEEGGDGMTKYGNMILERSLPGPEERLS